MGLLADGNETLVSAPGRLVVVLTAAVPVSADAPMPRCALNVVATRLWNALPIAWFALPRGCGCVV